MLPGAPHEARWIRPEPRRILAPEILDRMVHTAFPRCRVIEAQPLGDGLRNANFKLHLAGQPEPVILRIYEHDASLCRKELDLLRLAGGAVPVPEVIHAEPYGLEDLPPFTLARYVEGISLRDLRRSGDTSAMAEAAYSAGETLAAIGRATFGRPGWLGPGPAVTAPLLEGKDPTPRFVDLCLASIDLERRMPADLRDRTSGLVWRWAPQLARLDEEARLVHGDFNGRNLLVRCLAGQVVGGRRARLGVRRFRLSAGRPGQLPPLRARLAPPRRAAFFGRLFACRRRLAAGLAAARASTGCRRHMRKPDARPTAGYGDRRNWLN